MEYYRCRNIKDFSKGRDGRARAGIEFKDVTACYAQNSRKSQNQYRICCFVKINTIITFTSASRLSTPIGLPCPDYESHATPCANTAFSF